MKRHSWMPGVLPEVWDEVWEELAEITDVRPWDDPDDIHLYDENFLNCSCYCRPKKPRKPKAPKAPKPAPAPKPPKVVKTIPKGPEQLRLWDL